MTLSKKHCNKCNQTKTTSEFSTSKNTKDGYQNWCKSCFNKRMKSYNLESRYGITHAEKMQMIKLQNNCCVICNTEFKTDKSTHVDHCHKTGQIRAILCHSCNTGLGAFKDSVLILERAIDYKLKYAKKNTAAPVPTTDHSEGSVRPEPRSVPAPRTWEDRHYPDDYRRATQGENTYRSAKEGS